MISRYPEVINNESILKKTSLVPAYPAGTSDGLKKTDNIP